MQYFGLHKEIELQNALRYKSRINVQCTLILFIGPGRVPKRYDGCSSLGVVTVLEKCLRLC